MAKDERFRSRVSTPRNAGSWRARRGKPASRRARHERSSGAERGGGGRISYQAHVKQVISSPVEPPAARAVHVVDLWVKCTPQ